MDRTWRKSSFSAGEHNCLESAWRDGEVAVRDSKNPGAGHITIPVPAFAQLVKSLR
ncbi:DUF397 domain-containing protein [Kibdelosporangium persicum]|uniref:DUF397 domain-containing protein n=1 Tax=Kibdelosporangium persicum TaxID=2698649 RepID=UPI0028AC78A6|nr:DUF397 domain-containing protein [Kibdelosporangium persicum]